MSFVDLPFNPRSIGFLLARLETVGKTGKTLHDVLAEPVIYGPLLFMAISRPAQDLRTRPLENSKKISYFSSSWNKGS